MTGVDAAGVLTCSTPAPPPPPGDCPAVSNLLCPGNNGASLPQSPIGTVTDVSAGSCELGTYACVSGGPGNPGSWNLTSSNGNNCTTVTNTQSGSATDCGGPAYGGHTYTYNTTTTCPAYTVTTTSTFPTDCTPYCVSGSTNTLTGTCPAGFTGTWTETSTLDCVSGTWSAYTPTTPPPGACTCQPQADRTEVLPCPAGLTANPTGITQKNSWTCPGGTWTGWTTVSNDCTCVPQTNTWTTACPVGQIPNPVGITDRQKFTCPGGPGNPGVWGPVTQVSSDCIPIPPVVCKWTRISSVHIQASPIGQTVGAVCNGTGSPFHCGDNSSCSAVNSLGPPKIYATYNQCKCD